MTAQGGRAHGVARKTRPALSASDVERAVYFDFEGTSTDPPSLLGMLYTSPDGPCFEQHIAEAALWPCVAAESLAIDARYSVDTTDLRRALERLATIAVEGDRKIVAWSSYEGSVIGDSIPDGKLKGELLSRLVDLKPQAKRWKARMHPHVVFPRTVSRGTHTLAQYLELIGYSVPRSLGPENTGVRIRYVRDQLPRRNGEFAALTPTAKGKWTRMRKHNWHDCDGPRAVAEIVAR